MHMENNVNAESKSLWESSWLINLWPYAGLVEIIIKRKNKTRNILYYFFQNHFLNNLLRSNNKNRNVGRPINTKREITMET